MGTFTGWSADAMASVTQVEPVRGSAAGLAMVTSPFGPHSAACSPFSCRDRTRPPSLGTIPAGALSGTLHVSPSLTPLPLYNPFVSSLRHSGTRIVSVLSAILHHWRSGTWALRLAGVYQTGRLTFILVVLVVVPRDSCDRAATTTAAPVAGPAFSHGLLSGCGQQRQPCMAPALQVSLACTVPGQCAASAPACLRHAAAAGVWHWENGLFSLSLRVGRACC